MGSGNDLGMFLRGRRALIDPADAGLSPHGGSRRVPGLRREEVAQLAGISPDYYARLEQGRHPHVSESVLRGVATALQLDDVETRYLIDLARHRVARSRASADAPARIRPEMLAMLEALDAGSPAIILDHRRDILAANSLARALFTDFEQLPPRGRNLARFALLAPEARELYRDWEQVAETFTENLRLASARHPDDRRLNELVGEACVKVPGFSTWWDAHRVGQCSYGEQRFRHPVVGDLTLHHETLAFPADPDQMLCLYTAEPGTADAEALRLLASWYAEDRQTGDADGRADAEQGTSGRG